MMSFHFFFFFKRIIIDFFRILKNVKYIFFFFKFSLLNYSVLKRIGNGVTRFVYVYIIGYYFYLVYTFLYKKIDFFVLVNVINIIQAKFFFIFDEVMDLNIYYSKIKGMHLYAKLAENIGSFYHSHFRIYNRSFYALKRSRLTPAQFDAQHHHIAEDVYSDRYFSIYLYDIYYSVYIRSVLNYFKVNKLLLQYMRNKLKNNVLSHNLSKQTYLYIHFFFSLFFKIVKVITKVLGNRFKYTSLVQIPRERLLNSSFSEGFQGSLYYDKANFIKENATKLILNPVVQRALAPAKYKKISLLSNYQFNLFQTHQYQNLRLSNSNPYHLNSIQSITKEPDYSIFVEFRKSHHSSPNTNRFFLFGKANFFMIKDKFQFFIKRKRVHKFIHIVFGSSFLFYYINLFKLFKIDNRWHSIFRIQTFIDNGGWIIFFLLLIISIDLIAFFFKHIV